MKHERAGERLAAGWDCLVRGRRGAHGAETLGRDIGAEREWEPGRGRGDTQRGLGQRGGRR